MSNEQQTNDDGKVVVVFPNRQAASLVVDELMRKRPPGWSRKANAPYYKKEYGDWIKLTVDAMVVDRKPRIFRYKDIPDKTPNTIYLLINQSLKYLADDLKGAYAIFRQSIIVTREHGVGITLSFPDSDKLAVVKGEIFVPQEPGKPKWWKNMETWLEDVNDNKPFFQGQLMLTPSQMEELESQLSELGGTIMYSITSSEIKIIKTS